MSPSLASHGLASLGTHDTTWHGMTSPPFTKTAITVLSLPTFICRLGSSRHCIITSVSSSAMMASSHSSSFMDAVDLCGCGCGCGCGCDGGDGCNGGRGRGCSWDGRDGGGRGRGGGDGGSKDCSSERSPFSLCLCLCLCLCLASFPVAVHGTRGGAEDRQSKGPWASRAAPARTRALVPCGSSGRLWRGQSEVSGVRIQTPDCWARP